jgi:hypothetical protein
MINFVANSRVVDPGVASFYIGDFTGPAHNKVKLWWKSCPAPTASTAEYDFVPAQDDYIAFLHTDDTKPTLLEYGQPDHYNMNKAVDCLGATLYGAAAWDSSTTKVLVVNADRNETGLHLADINYQGTIDFASAWAALTSDPVTVVTPSDIRIDTSDHCSLLMTNDYYVSEVSVDDVLATTIVHNALKTTYTAGAEFARAAFDLTITDQVFPDWPIGGYYNVYTITAAAGLMCDYSEDTVPTLTIQWGIGATVPASWTDYIPTDPSYDQPNMTITGSVLVSEFGHNSPIWVRCKVTYGAKTFYSYAQRFHGTDWFGYSDGWEGYWYYYQDGTYTSSISITGTRTSLTRPRIRAENVLAKEIVRSYTNVAVTSGEPSPTSYTARIVEKDWADFWAAPTVIVSSIEMGSSAANNAYASFVSAVFADSTACVAFYYSGVLTLYRLAEGVWSEVTLPAVPDGYTLDSENPLILVDLDNPCLVTTIGQDDPYGTRLIIYDITLNTWTVQGGSLSSSDMVAFNTEHDKLFFNSAVDGLWHCTSVAQSNAVWYMQI